MQFIETPIFTRVVNELLSDEQYRDLQLALLLRPNLGRTIRGSAGLRKTRWSLRGHGKRGGVRVIYYWDRRTETFYMLHVYAKSEREDLTPQQIRFLSRLVREEFR